MMGTLAAALAKKGIRTQKDKYQAHITSDIEDVDGVMKITKIVVDYDLEAPPDKREGAMEAFAHYLLSCPAAQSVKNCIQLEHHLHFK